MRLLTQTTCFSAIKFKPYNIWDDVSFILMIVSMLILHVDFSYYLLYILKLVTDRLERNLNKENT